MENTSLTPIIVGNSHYNTLGLIRSFGEEGFNPILVLIINDECVKNSYVTKSKYIKECYFTTENNLINTLKNLNLDGNKGLIFPSGDSIADLIDVNYKELRDKYILPTFDEKNGLFSLANNKENMRERAEKYGFLTPKTLIISSLKDLDKAIIKFPVIIKSIHSQDASKSVTIYSDKETLKNDVSILLNHTPQVQIQTYLIKEKEIIFLGFAFNKDVAIPCVMEKLREFPEGFGCTGRGWLSPNVNGYFNIEKLKELIKSYNYKGLFSVEFLIIDNKPYFLEINFRNDGNGYFPGVGGVNLPVRLLQKYEGKNFNSNDLIKSSFFMIREYSDFKWFLNSRYSFLNWMSDIRMTKTFQYYNKYDKKPFFFFILNHLQKFIKIRYKKLFK